MWIKPISHFNEFIKVTIKYYKHFLININVLRN